MSKLTVEETKIYNKTHYALLYTSNYKTFKYFNDKEISFIMGMHTEDYRNILKDNGGIFYPERDTICFKNEEDAIRAIDNIESFLFMNKFINKIENR